jgi:hypothetical protein
VTATTEDQYLMRTSSSSDSTVTNCGSLSQPWRLEAPSGQRINIGLLDFTGSGNLSRDLEVGRRQYGYITEAFNKRNVSIYAVNNGPRSGFKVQRESALLMSQTNNVNIVMVSGTNNDNHNFLIKINGKPMHVSFS